MKKVLSIFFVSSLVVSLTSCDKLLNDNRFPLDTQSNSPEFWNNSINVQGEIDYLYTYYYGYGNGASWNGTFYYESLNDDQIGIILSGQVSFAPWYNTEVPSNPTTWSTPYVAIRRCNYIIENVSNNSMTASQQANYIAQARLNRAREYYDLVRHYGDVPLITTVLDPSDTEELYGTRTNRNEVMDFVLEDLNYAIENISAADGVLVFSQDMAKALKAEICLYEGSYAKYHQGNESRANQYFQEVVNAATPLLSKYQFCENYQSLYNSTYDGDGGTAKLGDNPEIILMKAYIKSMNGNSIWKYTSTATLICGMSKDAFDSYLFKDGKPLALTSQNTSDVGYMDETGLCIQDLLDVRDQRLAMSIDPYVYYGELQYKRDNSDYMRSSSGYGVAKFVNPLIDTYYSTTDYQTYACAPIFWKSKVALDYAEAKAELGQLTDADMGITLNPLYTRAGLPAQTVASLSSMNDPANNMGVSSLLWEVRRCRRSELMFDGFRYWDLIRWHQLDKLDTTNYPNINLGANITPALDEYPAQNVNGYFQNWAMTRTFTEREYLYPIGQTQINLNPNLVQNPGW